MEERPPVKGEDQGAQQESLLLSIYDRLLGRWVHNPRTRIIVGHSLVVFILVFAAALGVATIWTGVNEARFKGLGYFGIFFVNLISTSTFFIPVPGLTAAGQALIVSQASTLGAWQVGLVGGMGMALGEITAYVGGALGREVAHGRQVGGPDWFRSNVLKILRAIDWLMHHYGMLTLFLLSAIPNPLFEVAGLTAGAVRMNFWRFLLPVIAGKVARGMALAYIGEFSIHFLGL
jgi:membrane protein DedA with SNARE-associated domain